MTYPEIKLVDAPSATANVLFDFQDIGATPRREVEADDFSIGTPSLVGDVDAIDPLYGERVVSFTCRMRGTKAQVAAAQSTLARRLLAPGQGWLWVRLTASSRLLFFRTYRPEPGALSFDLVQTVSATAAETWTIDVDLPCEPFAYGELVTFTSQTISHDPTSGAIPLTVTLPAITGDAPTPVNVRVTPTSGPSGTRFGLRSQSGGPSPAVVGGAPIAAGGSSTTSVSDASAAGGTTLETTFSPIATTYPRATITPTLAYGRYRVFARIKPSVDFIGSMQVSINGFGPAVRTIVGADRWFWADLGALVYPNSYSSALPAGSGSFQVGFDAARTSASGTLRIDHVLFAREEGSRMLAIAPRTVLIGTTRVALDGTAQASWPETTAGVPVNGPMPEVTGSWVTATPGETNLLTVIPQLDSTATDNITSSTQVVASYYPRFLYVGDF